MNDLLTIVCPTYNRGHRALETVRAIAPKLPHRTSVMVLDNASVKFPEEYEQIGIMADKSDQLNYQRNDENLLFEGNFLKAFEVVNTNYLMFLSDEDVPNLNFIVEHLPLFEDENAYGAIRPSVAINPDQPVPAKNSCAYEAKRFEPGIGALCEFGLTGNYISGGIYNVHLVKSAGLVEKLKAKLYEQRFYPHLYLNSLISTKFPTKFMSQASVFEGEPCAGIGSNVTAYGQLGALAYGHRLDAFLAAREGISDALADSEFNSDHNFFLAYTHLVQKYLMLIIGVNGETYQRLGNLEILALSDSFIKYCMSAISLHKGFLDYAESLELSFNKMKNHILEMVGVTVSSSPEHSFGE